jgi:cysteine-rich repeat protein
MIHCICRPTGCNSLCRVEDYSRCYGGNATHPDVCIVGCGNGRRDVGEECDDGGAFDDDGCSALCIVEPGYTCVGGNETHTDSCSMCGNFRLEAGEECDFPGDGLVPSLGYTYHGLTTSPPYTFFMTSRCDEFCHAIPGFTCTSFVCYKCGDGIVQWSESGDGELCDDGNDISGKRRLVPEVYFPQTALRI